MQRLILIIYKPLDKAYEENKIKDPETLVGEFAKIGVQFGIPGGAVFKVGNRIRGIAKAKAATKAKTRSQKLTQVAKRVGYMGWCICCYRFFSS